MERGTVLRELVRCATLAASSHNTQCWKFSADSRGVSILPDLTRRTPVVDPDDHHLFVSLGCAAENLVQAALANGLAADVRFEAGPDAVRIGLSATRPVASSLYQAIPRRQCSRSVYDGAPLATQELALLEQAAAAEGTGLLMVTARTQIESILDFVVRGNTAQMGDAAYVRELKAWLRFSDEEAVRTRDGLFSRTSGNPVVPRWLGSLLFAGFYTASSENDKYAKQVRSSSGIAVFVSDATDKAHWVQVGRSYQRFALQAAALNIQTAFLNQPVEVASVRAEFARSLGIGNRRPDLVVRFGRGPEMPRSLRRPVDAVMA